MDSLSNSNFHVDYNVVFNCAIVLIFNNWYSVYDNRVMKPVVVSNT